MVADFGLQGAGGRRRRVVPDSQRLFLHAGLIHIGFNMFLLFILGRLLEPAIGTPRFVFLYFASLLAGSFGALALTDPFQITVGASGAVFGMLGATVADRPPARLQRDRGSARLPSADQPGDHLRRHPDQRRRPPRRADRRCRLRPACHRRRTRHAGPEPACDRTPRHGRDRGRLGDRRPIGRLTGARRNRCSRAGR